MKGNNLRLRLVIRRNSLPEVRLLFPISLDEEPTIANLLEQVNDTIPLESTDWSLDDYVVEVQDSHGHGFECLHFQRVESILDNDEELLIRPLFTVDRKKRLLSGREQISADGRHLVDGVPFGRPWLRVPQGRPPIDIPPLKRRRITAGDDQDELAVRRGELDDEEEEDDDYVHDEDYIESEDQPLRLTEHGEQMAEPKRLRNLRSRQTFSRASLDEVQGEGNYPSITGYLTGDEVAAKDKRRNVRFSDGLGEEDDRQDQAGIEADEDSQNYQVEDAGGAMGDDSFDDDEDDSADLDEAELQDELLALERGDTPVDDGMDGPQEDVDGRSPKRRGKPPAKVKEGLELSVLDKIASLRAAFPTAQFNMCEKALRSSDMNEREAYWKLRKSNQPKMTADQMRQHLDMLSLSTTVQPSSSNAASTSRSNRQGDQDGAESEAESVDSVVKYHDEHGFPPGSILDGSASRLAAEALRESGVNVKIPVHFKFGDEEDEDHDTPAGELASKSRRALLDDPVSDEEEEDGSSYSSSSSESNDSDDSDSEGGEEEEEEDDDGSSDDSDGDDSGPEVASSRPREALSKDRTEDDDPDSSSDKSSDADDDSSVGDDGPGSKRRASAGANKKDNMESQSSSEVDDFSDSSSDTSSNSDESGEGNTEVAGEATAPARGGGETPGNDSAPAVGTQPSVPLIVDSKPGSGSSKTRARNQRRRAAKQAKKAAEAAARFGVVAQTVDGSAGAMTPAPVSESPVNANSAEFLKRKKALLEKLADQATDSELPPATVPADLDTAMSDAPASVSALDGLQHAELDASTTLTGDSTGPATASASSSSRRTTLDVGAGRRMLFASLGLRNPKTKADEDKIRAGLMKGVKPLANPRLGQLGETANRENPMPDQAPRQEQEQDEEDPEAWREKITYRAVECCQEGVVLSEPPFPFVQRWDPQQQYQNHKRGKRKRRNQEQYQEEYYNDHGDDQSRHKKQKQGYYGEDETSFMTGADNTGYGYEEEVTLNYDDYQDMRVTTPEKNTADNNVSQLTDADDLPSLPSDLSRLPSLQQGEARPGMVITWKQMLVSKATGWAPQVLDLTAVIVQTADDTDALRVVLAKRDRDLDGNEKTFDSEGNRVYDRFEAPDMDDEDSEENVDGYRTVYYSDMMQPRILQRPVISAHTATLAPIDESQVKTTDEVQVEQAVGDTAVTEARLSDSNCGTNDTPFHRHDKANPEKEGTRSVNVDADDSVIPETILQEHSERPQSLEAEESAMHAENVSITDDQRRDISLIMHDAGFQDEIDPVVAQGPRFSVDDMSSPSRQLDEEMSEAAAAVSHKEFRPPVRAPSIHSDASSLRNQIIADSARENPRANADDNVSVPDSQREVTPTVAYPQLPVPSSASSAHSGRQPDPHFTQGWNHDDMLPSVDETGDELLDNSRGRREEESVEVDRTPTKRILTPRDTDGSISLDSSPLPSLEEIFSSARSSQGPARSVRSAAVEARKPEEKQDLEYEKAMRLVDEGEDLDDGEEWSEQHGQLKRELSSQVNHPLAISKTATSNLGPLQRALSRSVKTNPREEADSSSDTAPAVTSRRRKTSVSRNFVVPNNAQVFSLLTSSPEAELQENYAEDSIDSTYEDQDQEDSDLPSGSGWAKKKLPPKKDRTRRGVSVSALPSEKRQTATVNKRPAASQGPSSKIVGSKSGKIRRKTWART